MAEYNIKVRNYHEAALDSFLDDEDQIQVYRALDEVRREGLEPSDMEPIARLAFYWILASNGIDPQALPADKADPEVKAND